MSDNCAETCLDQPCNYWIDNNLATCSELRHLSDCSHCGDCSVCTDGFAESDGLATDEVVYVLSIFCALLCVLLLAFAVGCCIRLRREVSAQVRPWLTNYSSLLFLRYLVTHSLIYCVGVFVSNRTLNRRFGRPCWMRRRLISKKKPRQLN